MDLNRRTLWTGAEGTSMTTRAFQSSLGGPGGPQAVGLALVFRFTDAECTDKGHCIPPSPSRDRPTRDYYVCLNPVETIRFMLTVSSLIDFTGTFLCLGVPEYMMCILRPLNPSQSRYLMLTGSPPYHSQPVNMKQARYVHSSPCITFTFFSQQKY